MLSGECVEDPVPTDFMEKFGASPRVNLLTRFLASMRAFATTFRRLGSDEYVDKVSRLAWHRGESFVAAAGAVSEAGFRLLPTKTDRLDFPVKNDVVRQVRNIVRPVYEVHLDDGSTFRDWGGSVKHQAGFWLLKDKLSGQTKYDQYFANSAAYRSYIHGCSRFEGDKFMPGIGGVIVEAGAYVGYKAIAMARRVGDTGRVIAIEADWDNFTLLVENIKLNELEHVVLPIHAAVSDQNGTKPLFSGERMNKSISPSDEKRHLKAENWVPTRRLETLFAEHHVEAIDFLNIQVNGAELEALRGIGAYWDRTGVISIISRARVNDLPTIEGAITYAKKRGGKFLTTQVSDDLTAVSFSPSVAT